ARIEPDVENVRDHLPRLAGTVAEEALARTFCEPRVCTFGLESFEDAGIDSFVLQHFAICISENADRHAPGALTRQDPVRTIFDHGAKARLACIRDEAGVIDRLQRARTQRRAVAEFLV